MFRVVVKKSAERGFAKMPKPEQVAFAKLI
jgi:hypothetical protein